MGQVKKMSVQRAENLALSGKFFSFFLRVGEGEGGCKGVSDIGEKKEKMGKN